MYRPSILDFFFFFGKRLKHRVSRSSHRRNKGKLYEWHSIQVTQLSNPSWWMGLERVWSVPACLPRLLQLFSISSRCLPGRWTRAASPWWAGTEPQLLLCVLTSTCSWASLTLHRSIDLVRMQWDIGVLFGVVRILKPTHTLNYSNCKKKKKVNTCWKFTMFEQLLQTLSFTTLWYKYYYYPHFTEEKTEAQPKKVTQGWRCESKINLFGL